jgi:hypothetical protein
MARRRKTSPKGFGGNSKLAVVTQGFRIACKGHRTAEGTKMQPDKDATPVFVGRIYTGVPRGKAYPYAGKKRGGNA